MPQARIHAGSFSPRFAAWFSSYVRWLVRRKFHAVRIAQPEVFTRLANDQRPLIGVMNHPGWWDPLSIMVVHGSLLGLRPAAAPMDNSQLEKFGFFKRLGLFGVDPDDPGTQPAMMQHMAGVWANEPRTVLWVTPQGRFVDPRVPVEPRPGTATIAARTPGVRLVSLAIEYVFWLDQKPEILLRAAEIPTPDKPTTPHWHRAIQHTMQHNADALASLAIARNPAPFQTLISSNSGINPAMNLWLRLRGKRPEIDSARVAPAGSAVGGTHA